MIGPRLLPTAREQWDAQDEANRAHAEQLWLERMRQQIASGPRVTLEQGIFTVSTEAAQLDFDLLTTDRRTGETYAELTIYLTDAVNLGKLLHKGRLNLLSGDRRERLAKYLAGRTRELAIDWADVLEQAATAVLGLYRAGEPAILLRDAPDPPGAGAPWIPPIIGADGSTILFGDGGAGKSLLALALAASGHTGEPLIGGMPPAGARRVGFLDWEWSAHVHRRRLQKLVGGELPDLVYVPCRLPIREERDRLRRIIRDHRLDYLVIDSVGLACGGDPQLPEVAIGFFAILRELERDALLVAHVTNMAARTSADRPFGSAYWHNSARSTWYVRGQGDRIPGHLSIGLFNKKANDGPLSAPLSVEIEFTDERLRMARGDVHDVPDLASQIPLKVRMIELLAAGARPMHEIAESLDAKVEAVKKVCQRDDGRRFVKHPGPDGVYRIGLLRRADS